MPTERMQYCFNCGDELGVYARYHGDDPECCDKKECQRELTYTLREMAQQERDHLDWPKRN